MPATVGTGVLPCPSNANGRRFVGRPLDHRIAGIEVELRPMAILIKGPASALGIAGRIHIETLAPGPGVPLQFQQSLHCLVISLEGKAGHQFGSILGAIRFQ